MSYDTLPIVGAFFRPPAKILLEHLAVGTPLTLLAEPTNAFDPNAIAVWVNTADIPSAAHASLEQALPSAGFSLDDILGQSAVHLGYIPKEFAAQLKASATIVDNVDYPVLFSVNAKGAPRVRFEYPVL